MNKTDNDNESKDNAWTMAMIAAAAASTGNSVSDDNRCTTTSPKRSKRNPLPKQDLQPGQEWQGAILFPLHVLDDKTTDIDSIFGKPPQELDICQHLGGQKRPLKRLYFCPETYPPPVDHGEMDSHTSKFCDAWMKLKTDLFNAARSAGNPVVSNGRRDKKGITRAIKCGYCHTRRRKWDKGWEMPAENRPGQPPSKKKKITCNFQFTVTWDRCGFYIGLERNAGHPWHTNHPKVIGGRGAEVPEYAKTSQDLEQIIRSTCEMADGMGPEGVKKLEESLLEFQTWCKAKKAESTNNESVEADNTTTTPGTPPCHNRAYRGRIEL